MNNRSVLLISANTLKDPYPVYPIGISFVETYLKKTLPDIEILFVDMNISSYEELAGFLKEKEPGIIGISLRNIDDTDSIKASQFIDEYKTLVDFIKKYSKARIVIGGAGFSIFPLILFRHLNPDFGIVGEGENSFSCLIESLMHGQDFRNIGGLVFNENGTIKVNPVSVNCEQFDLEYRDELVDYYWKNAGVLNIQLKRGCNLHCNYCTYPLIEGHKIRTLDVDKIISAITKLKKKHGVNYIFFTDSVFNIKSDSNTELAIKLINSGLNIDWGGYFNFNNLTEDHLKLYKQAGLKHIEFGTDSISDRQLKNFNKPFTVNDILEISALCQKLKINYAHFLILASYGETEETLTETFENSKRINGAIFFPFIGARIYPRTELSRIAIEEGIVSSEDTLLYPKYYISSNVNVETIKKRAKDTNKRWIFPDEDQSEIMKRMREKNWRGPLWEYSKYL